MGTQSWKKGHGPLVPFADGFRARLSEIGHAEGTLKSRLVLTGRLNRWLTAEGLRVEELTSEIAQQFLDHLRTAGRRVPTLRSLTSLLNYLRASGVLPAEPTAEPTPREELLAAYHRHLIHDRGLSATTVRRYENFAKRFLAERARQTASETGAEELTSAEAGSQLRSVPSETALAIAHSPDESHAA